jgi:hypothetical protein
VFLESILVSCCVGECVIPIDAQECNEQAKRCIKLAAETTDPHAQEILISTAQNWERLAAKLADASGCHQ